MSVAIHDAFRYITTSGTAVGESDATIVSPGVNGTLNLSAGFGITLVADPVNKKITITNTGNGTGALTTITTQNASGTYYPIFTRAANAGDYNALTGTYQMSTMYYETTTDPLTYNPGTGTLSTVNLNLGGTLTINGVTNTGTTGTGNVVFSSNPTLVTPALGIASATSINKIALTAVATGATITATDGTTITLPTTTGTVALNNQTFFLGTTSVAINRATASQSLTGITSIDGYAAGIAGGAIGYIPYQSAANTTLFVAGNTTTTPQFLTSTGTGSAAQAPTLTGSTGTGSVVLATSPSLSTPSLGAATATSINKVAFTSVATGATITATDGTTITLPTSTGTVPLNNQTMFIGTTSVAINRATSNLALTGISSVAFPGSTSGTATLQATATAGTPTLSLPITTGTLIGTGDSATVSNTMLANSSVTFGSTAVSLGSTSTSLAGLTSIDGTTALTSAFATPNGTVALLGAATTLNLANLATTVTGFGAATSLAIGNTATGAQTVNMFTASTAGGTYNFATGITTTGNTKTINIGTGGLGGSITAITLGSTAGTSGVTVNGNLTVNSLLTVQQTVEKFASPSIVTNAVTLDFTSGAIFSLGSNAANITANFTNIPGTAGQVITTTLIITQGSTAYIPSTITINGGGSVTPKWQNGSAPTGVPNHVDIVSFTFITTASNTWTTIGGMVDYN